MSLSKCPFRENNFMCTGESPRNFPSRPHENDTCAVTPCTAIQGQNKCQFSEGPLRAPLWATNPRVRKISVRNSGAGKLLRQFYGRLEKKRPFCRKSHVHKIPRFRGGGYFWVLGGGGEVPILFLWARGFF